MKNCQNKSKNLKYIKPDYKVTLNNNHASWNRPKQIKTIGVHYNEVKTFQHVYQYQYQIIIKNKKTKLAYTSKNQLSRV